MKTSKKSKNARARPSNPRIQKGFSLNIALQTKLTKCLIYWLVLCQYQFRKVNVTKESAMMCKFKWKRKSSYSISPLKLPTKEKSNLTTSPLRRILLTWHFIPNNGYWGKLQAIHFLFKNKKTSLFHDFSKYK